MQSCTATQRKIRCMSPRPKMSCSCNTAASSTMTVHCFNARTGPFYDRHRYKVLFTLVSNRHHLQLLLISAAAAHPMALESCIANMMSPGIQAPSELTLAQLLCTVMPGNNKCGKLQYTLVSGMASCYKRISSSSRVFLCCLT